VLVVLWRVRYKLSLRDLAEMFLIRGFVFSYEAVRDWEAKLTRPWPRIFDECSAAIWMSSRQYVALLIVAAQTKTKGRNRPELVRGRDVYPGARLLEVSVPRDRSRGRSRQSKSDCPGQSDHGSIPRGNSKPSRC